MARLRLASLYEELLQDKAAARELLERAWKIDPGSKEVAEAFRTRGYRLVKDQWVETAPPRPGMWSRSRYSLARPRVSADQTPEEVLQQIGSKPDRKAFSGTKGQLIEQWIFQVPTRRHSLRQFPPLPGRIHPRVVSDYFLPQFGDCRASSSRHAMNGGCKFSDGIAIFSLIFPNSAAECGGFPTPLSFLSRSSG